MMTKRKKIYLTLLAMCMALSFCGSVFAENPKGADMAGDPTVYVEPAQIDREAMIEELVAQWGSDDITAYQLRAMLEKADESKLLAVWQADSLDEINTILRGGTDLDGPLVLGDSNMDYTFTPVTPCRIVDTRNAGGIMTAGSTREFYVYGNGAAMTAQGGNASGCASPVGEPRGVMINVTAVPSGNGNLRAYPANVSTPDVSLVNYKSGVNIANAAAVKTYFGIGRELEIFSYASSHVIIDVMGYYDVPTIPAGVEYAGGDQMLTISSGTDVTVRSISVNAPTSSYCVVNASANMELVNSSSYARCSITTGSSLDFNYLHVMTNNGTGSLDHSFAATRGFSQSSGSTTYRLVCDAYSGSYSVWDSTLTANCTRNKY